MGLVKLIEVAVRPRGRSIVAVEFIALFDDSAVRKEITVFAIVVVRVTGTLGLPIMAVGGPQRSALELRRLAFWWVAIQVGV